ncbi:MAG: M20 family peptidase, partial [Acidobacteria bacterium]|nr:M20 family peptidase [Acidobacteriota bacterium]
MDSLFDYATRNRGAIVALIQEMVECESPSDDPAAVRRFADLVASRLAPMASTLITPAGHL